MKHSEVDTLTFKQMQDENSYVLIDVRTPDEFSSGHLKGAKNQNFYDEKFEESIDELDKRKKYLLYCSVGSRSRQAMFLMRDLGFEEVYNLSGGIRAWNEQGFEIET